ncbi:MAG TPA: hypothetical protein PKY59_17065 [Pyrinomonadaceae bacterium]|nr:hypothetical protein [Pyrinomonadaceae bacterium]
MKRISIIFAILLLSFINTFAQNPPKNDFAKLRENVRNLIKKGDTKTALEMLETADNETRKNYEYHLLKADIFLKDRNFDKANDHFQFAFDLELLELFTDLEMCRSSYLTQFQNAFMKCDTAFLSFQNLSKINIKRQQDFAVADAMQNLLPFNFKRSEELDAMLEDILFYRGAAAVQVKRYDEAVELLSIVIKRKPNYLFAHKERAAAFRGLGKIAEAEADEKSEKEMIK